MKVFDQCSRSRHVGLLVLITATAKCTGFQSQDRFGYVPLYAVCRTAEKSTYHDWYPVGSDAMLRTDVPSM
ncbi:hypothetical protein BC826DRAFT_990931 [Russula brevipes]|nr:hypothetical protein BC826DRAFT_990931 [Russula brevipes]